MIRTHFSYHIQKDDGLFRPHIQWLVWTFCCEKSDLILTVPRNKPAANGLRFFSAPSHTHTHTHTSSCGGASIYILMVMMVVMMMMMMTATMMMMLVNSYCITISLTLKISTYYDLNLMSYIRLGEITMAFHCGFLSNELDYLSIIIDK